MAKSLALLHAKSFLAAPIGYLDARFKWAGNLGIDRWSRKGSLQDGWDERTALIAQKIPAGSSVLEFGAGNERIRQFLPEGSSYQPSDIVARSAETLVCDLNASFPKLDKKYDVIVFSGVLEYIKDIQALLAEVRKHCSICIMSYASIDALECITTRLRSGWINHHSRAQIEATIAGSGFTIAEKFVWNMQDIYVLR